MKTVFRDRDSIYEVLKTMNRISQSSVLKKVKVLRNATGHSLPEKEELQLQKLLNDKVRKRNSVLIDREGGDDSLNSSSFGTSITISNNVLTKKGFRHGSLRQVPKDY